MKTWIHAGFAAALALTLCPATASAKGDTIIMLTGRSKRNVDVSSETFDEVAFKGERGKESVPGNKVREIIHGEQSRSYKAGEGQRKGGQYNKAIKSYTKAMEQAKGKYAWAKTYCLYNLGECHRLAGEGEKAVSFYKKAAKDAKHLLYPRVMIGLGQAQGVSEKYDDAVSTLQKVSDGNFGFWRAHADYAMGNVYLKKGDMGKARRAFARVQSSRDDPKMRVAGIVGEGESYLLEKNYGKAIDFFRRILRDKDVPGSVAAGAWAGIGDCEMAKAEKGDKKAEKRALLAYLTVVVQYSGTPGAYPKALFKASKLYAKFGRKDQAEALMRELKSRCPTSSYAKEADGAGK